jgi:hypothetical protein
VSAARPPPRVPCMWICPAEGPTTPRSRYGSIQSAPLDIAKLVEHEHRVTVARLRTLMNVIVPSSGRHAPTTGSVGGDMSHPPSKTAVYPDRDWI